MVDVIKNEVSAIINAIEGADLDGKIELMNYVKSAMYEVSPMKAEPVDCVLWVKGTEIEANDYNPNSVASPEMELLRTSIGNDGYTQPIVTMRLEEGYEVIDGFHRNRVGKEFKDVRERIKGYLPVTVIRNDREDRSDRIASTIRHNRARGKHRIEAMSDIVLELKRRNWSDKKIGKQLGMDPDEVLRLAQITGLAEMFTDEDFTEAWEVADSTECIGEEPEGITVEEVKKISVERSEIPDKISEDEKGQTSFI
jgi:ParB-like chromosome segregation protein Spo0J